MSEFIARTGTNILESDVDPQVYGSYALALGSIPVHHHEWHFASAEARDKFLKDYADGVLRKKGNKIKDLDL